MDQHRQPGAHRDELGNFDTGSIAAGASATVTFDEPGTFTYICSFHPFMTGTVTVV